MDGFEGRQHFVADTVPRVRDVVVGAVGHVGQTEVRAIRLDVLAAEVDQRPDDAAAHRRDAGQTGEAGAAREVEEDGLRVVRRRVGGGNAHPGQVRVLPEDPVGDLLEEAVAHLPAAGLEGLSAGRSQFRHIGVEGRERDAPFLTEGPAELLVPVGLRAADAVVDMTGVQRERRYIAHALREFVQNRKKRHRVGSPGKAHQDGGLRGKHLVTLQSKNNMGQKFAVLHDGFLLSH